jgi:hypothetical protein
VTLITLSMEHLARAMWQHASAGNTFYDGRNPNTPYFQAARRIHLETGTLLLFTRDVGHHTSGWFKNPDYERCYHLSLSFWDLERRVARPFEHRLARAWVRAFYGEWVRCVWEEGSKFRYLPQLPEVRHYRVFCDEHWQPILPRGEVYSREFTEKGWKSFSELNEGKPRIEGEEP